MSVTVMEGLKSCQQENHVMNDSNFQRPTTDHPRRRDTHIQQGTGVNAEAVGAQHSLKLIQAGVYGVQVLIELISGRIKGERPWSVTREYAQGGHSGPAFPRSKGPLACPLVQKAPIKVTTARGNRFFEKGSAQRPL